MNESVQLHQSDRHAADTHLANSQRRAALWFAAWLSDDATLHVDNAADLENEIDLDNKTVSSKARCHFSGQNFYLPPACGADADAAIAHFYAHFAASRHYGGARFDAAALKPIQVVLVSLFEDARVEQLALCTRPGLRRLWQPYIDALDCSGSDVPALLRRLTVALFDRDHRDGHAWVDKAQRLFFADDNAGNNPINNDWLDPAFSRFLGNLLGNDLGQMRLQFNWKSYCVEPSYRDDHRGLWLDAAIPEQEDDVRAAVHIDRDGESVAQRFVGAPAARAGNKGETIGVAPTERPVLARVAEWDCARRISRAAWVTVRAAPVAEAENLRLQNILRQHGARLRDMVAETAAQKLQSLISRRRQWDGDSLDLDACVHFSAERNAGMTPLPRIYSRRLRHRSPRALVVMIDASLSSADPVADNLSQLDCAIAATWLLADHAEHRGDRVAVYAFQSEGRNALHISALKTWTQLSDSAFAKRLCGLQSAYSTRLGAALRYAPTLFAENEQFGLDPTAHRELIVITDGEVSDIDCADARYLPGDAQHAVQTLRSQHIDVNGIGFGTVHDHFANLFGQRGKAFGPSHFPISVSPLPVAFLA